MPQNLYRYDFSDEACLREVEKSLRLAVLAAAILHGEVLVRIDVDCDFDPIWRVCVIDARTPPGRDLNRLFAGFLLHRLGGQSFAVSRVSEPDRRPKHLDRESMTLWLQHPRGTKMSPHQNGVKLGLAGRG